MYYTLIIGDSNVDRTSQSDETAKSRKHPHGRKKDGMIDAVVDCGCGIIKILNIHIHESFSEGSLRRAASQLPGGKPFPRHGVSAVSNFRNR